eukprot:6268581-Amphidinium_carterae.1
MTTGSEQKGRKVGLRQSMGAEGTTPYSRCSGVARGVVDNSVILEALAGAKATNDDWSFACSFLEFDRAHSLSHRIPGEGVLVGIQLSHGDETCFCLLPLLPDRMVSKKRERHHNNVAYAASCEVFDFCASILHEGKTSA